MKVKDLKDSVVEYLKSDSQWSTMTEDTQRSLLFLAPAAALGIFGPIVLKDENHEVVLVDLIDSLIQLRETNIDLYKKLK